MRHVIHLRSFAPWREFGGVAPRRGQHGGHFHGDGRGFSLVTDDPHVTSRMNFWVGVDLEARSVLNQRLWSDLTIGPRPVGPIGFVGSQDTATATPKATVMSYVDRQDLVLNVTISGADPLVPGAPDIDASGEYRLQYDAPNSKLLIYTRISGDQFPACESFIADSVRRKIFLGGFAPSSRSFDELIRLFGQLNRPHDIYFYSNIEIIVSGSGSFERVRGTWGNQLSPPMISMPGLYFPLNAWNDGVMRAIPMPADSGTR